MSDIPTFSDAAESAQSAVSQHGRTLIPWLPDPERCPACGALMYAAETFDPREAFHVTSWECRECETHYPRDPEYGEGVVAGPRRGSSRLRSVLRE